MLTIITGNLGSGKTVFLTILGYYSKKHIVSNFKLMYAHKEVEQFSISKFIKAEYANCIIFLDEAYTYLESRISGSNLNRVMSYILFQSRKKNVDLYLTAQLRSTLDIRFRQLAEYYIIARKEIDRYTYFLQNKANQFTQTSILFTTIVPFYSMYDTNEIILDNDNNDKFAEKLLTGKEKMIEAQQIASQIIEAYKNYNITHDLVHSYFITNEFPEFLEKLTYTQVKLLKQKVVKKSSKKVVKK